MSRPTVLIVEDEPGLRLIYERILSHSGYEVLEAINGIEALDILQQHAPDLIFLDMLLPLVNGQQVLDFITSEPHLQHCYVVIVSSNKEFEQYASHLTHGEFVLKPILPTQIREIAGRLLKHLDQ